MSNNKGFTLVETLFAFQVYLCIIYMLVSLSQTLHFQYNHLTDTYHEILEKEEVLLEESDVIELIEKVLR